MENIELLLNPIDWSGISAITSILMLLVNIFLLISIIFAYRTIKEEVRNRDSNLLLWAMNEISDIKSALVQINKTGDFAKGELGTEEYAVLWDKKTINSANRVSITLQRLSYMAMSNLISKKHFSNMWGPVFISSWSTLEPFIHDKRFNNNEPLTLKEGAFTRKDFEAYVIFLKKEHS